MAYSTKVKDKVFRLRTIQKFSIKKIANMLGISQATISIWVKPYPLDQKLLHYRMRKAAKKTATRARTKKAKRIIAKSDLYNTVMKHGLDPHEIGKVAEAAVALRLVSRGYEIYASVFDGQKLDLIVQDKHKKLKKIRMKTAR